MALRTREQLASLIETLVNDNTTEDITPLDVRTVLEDIVDSSINSVDEAALLGMIGTADVDANVPNVAALVASTVPPNQLDYRVKADTNQVVYRTIDAGVNWEPMSTHVEVDTVADLANLTEIIPNQTAYVRSTRTTNFYNLSLIHI